MDIKLPFDVSQIINKLNLHGYQAFIVGGCVRDALMSRIPKDWDITTNATPDTIQAIFDKTVPTGIKHGTITILLNGNSYEVTTFRIDGEYSDNRRPDFVKFTTSIEDDLSRRDFTMNAIAYNPSIGLVDPFFGIEDIKHRVIRAVGVANKRFNEDALRMLRAIRFSAQLQFSIESDTLCSIKNNNFLIKNISVERVRDEISKLLVSAHPTNFLLLRETDLLRYIIPEFYACFDITQNNPYHMDNVAIHSLNSVSKIENDLVLRWTMLLHDIGKSETKSTDENGIDHFYGHEKISTIVAESILKRLKFDNSTIDAVCTLITHHDRQIKAEAKAIRRGINVIGEQYFNAWLKVKRADILAQSKACQQERLDNLDDINNIYSVIQTEKQCISLKKLAINGEDLLSLGLPKGKQIGIILNKLLKLVIDTPELNTKELLLNQVHKIKNSDLL